MDLTNSTKPSVLLQSTENTITFAIENSTKSTSVGDFNKKKKENTLTFKHPIYTTVLSEGNYGRRGALVTLRPEPLSEV